MFTIIKINTSGFVTHKMGLKITSKKNYIGVESIEGVNYWEILEGIGKVLKMPEFPEKKVLWLFHEGTLMLLYDDLHRIKGYIEEYYPKDSNRDKIAIVVETEFQFGLAEKFVTIAEDLPNDIKVFFDIHEAEEWITK